MFKNISMRTPFTQIRPGIDNIHPQNGHYCQKQTGWSMFLKPNNPTTGRFILGSDNPDNLGWLRFLKKE